MSIQTYYFYQAGSIPGVPGTFSAGTAVDIDTSTMTVSATRPIGSTVPTTILLTTAQATGSTSATLQSAAAATGTGTALTVLGMGTVAFTVTGTFSATITWEGSEDGTNFSAILATPYGSSTPATTTTATGVFIAGCAGLQQVRARISSYTSGNVTVTAHAVPLSGGSGSGGGGGGGAVTIADGADTAQGTTTDAAYSGSGAGTAIAILKKLVTELSGTLGIQQADLSATGTISAAQSSINTPVSNATVVLAVGLGQSTWKAQLLAGGGGFTSATTIVADKTPDGGTTWYSASFKVTGGTTSVSSIVGPGPLELTGNAAGVSHVRIRCSVLNSTETIAVTLRGGAGISEIGLISQIPTGTNSIGQITANAGTNLNTSLLALETGGNLASIKSDADSIKTYTSAFADSAAVTGTVTNDGDVVSISLPGGQATVLANILLGTLVGTLLFEASPDSGTTWVGVSGSQAGTSSVSTSTTTAGVWRIGVAGFTNFRVRLHPTTSGTSGTITVRATQGAHNVAVVNASTLGQQTMANSAPVVLPSDQIVPVKSSFTEVASLSAGSLNADLVVSTDVSAYKWWSLHITGTWSGRFTYQCSNDNVNWGNLAAVSLQSQTTTATSTTVNDIVGGPVAFRYLRVRMTTYNSGTGTGTLELYTAATQMPVSGVLSNQNGTWTVQPGNVANTTSWVTKGATNNGAQAANTASNTVVKGSAGTLYNAIVTTTGTAGLIIYDNASTNSGTILLSIPANAAVGTIYGFPGGMPAANGITSAGVSNCPGVTFAYGPA